MQSEPVSQTRRTFRARKAPRALPEQLELPGVPGVKGKRGPWVFPVWRAYRDPAVRWVR